jgi:hypothetical protein
MDAIGDLPNADEFDELLNSDSINTRLGEPSDYAKKLRDQAADGENLARARIFNTKLMTSSLRTKHTRRSIERFEATEWGKVEPKSRFLKLDPEGLCNTLRAGTGSDLGAFTSPRPIHPFFPRCITNREAARLHSYPDWFRFHVTKWHGFRQIGNSVPPLLGRAVARMIMDALGKKPEKLKDPIELGDTKLLSLNMTQAAAIFNVSPDITGKRIRINEKGNEMSKKSRYEELLGEIFKNHYRKNIEEFEFRRNEIEKVAKKQGIILPKNLGDVIYSFRYRKELPDDIKKTAEEGFEWVIEGAGRSKYRFRLTKINRLIPKSDLNDQNTGFNTRDYFKICA